MDITKILGYLGGGLAAPSILKNVGPTGALGILGLLGGKLYADRDRGGSKSQGLGVDAVSGVGGGTGSAGESSLGTNASDYMPQDGDFENWAVQMYGPQWRMQHPEDQVYQNYMSQRRNQVNPRRIAMSQFPTSPLSLNNTQIR